MNEQNVNETIIEEQQEELIMTQEELAKQIKRQLFWKGIIMATGIGAIVLTTAAIVKRNEKKRLEEEATLLAYSEDNDYSNGASISE